MQRINVQKMIGTEPRSINQPVFQQCLSLLVVSNGRVFSGKEVYFGRVDLFYNGQINNKMMKCHGTDVCVKWNTP